MNMNSNNVVVVNGYLSSELVERELSDGSVVTQWRLKVPRQNETGSDSIPCSTVTPSVLKVLQKADLHMAFEAEGDIRSRYWNAGGVTGSRVEVNVIKLRKLKHSLSP